MPGEWSRRGAARLLGAGALWPLRAAFAEATTVEDETWHDASRSRALPVRLRWPDTPGPWPLVVYSHGLGGSRDGGDAWGEAWRTAGLAVLHVQHPGSDSAVLRAGWVALRAAASAEQLFARVADVRFVLDEIERRQRAGVARWREVQPERIGMAGHSFGAQTTQALAGQRYRVPAALAESRLRGFIALSPSLARGGLGAGESFGGVTRPFLACTGSHDGDPFGSFDTGAPRAAVYDGLPPGQRALLWLDGADHMSFAGNRALRIVGTGPFRRHPQAAQRERDHHLRVARITALWWRAMLAGSAPALELLRTSVQLGAGDRFEFD